MVVKEKGKEMKNGADIIIDANILKKLSKMILLFANTTVGEETDKLVYLHFANNQCNLYLENQFGVFDYTFNVTMADFDKTVILDAKTFVEVVKNGNENIKLILNDNYTIFVFGKSKYKIPVIKGVLNKIEEKDGFISVELDVQWLNYKIGCVAQCLAKDDLAPALENIYIYDNMLLATDSTFGAVAKFKDIKKLNGNILNKMAIGVLAALPETKISIGFKNGILIGKGPQTSFQISCDGIEYPIDKIASIVDAVTGLSKSKVAITFSPVDIEQSINRLCYFVDKDSPFVRMTILANENSVHLGINNHDYEGNEYVPIMIERMVDNYSFSFDGKALAKTLKALNGECHLFSNGNNDIQYITDLETYIFFFGSNK